MISYYIVITQIHTRGRRFCTLISRKRLSLGLLLHTSNIIYTIQFDRPFARNPIYFIYIIIIIMCLMLTSLVKCNYTLSPSSIPSLYLYKNQKRFSCFVVSRRWIIIVYIPRVAIVVYIAYYNNIYEVMVWYFIWYKHKYEWRHGTVSLD
jgi:hypothetical protein